MGEARVDVYEGLEPAELWRHFAALNGIPRPSGSEAAAREYVLQVAREHGAEAVTDEAGNAVVRVPATAGLEAAPTVVIQAHLDMVCEKRPDVVHDFDRDPIRPRVEGEWVYGSGTTLGSDNGIGAAAALAVLTDSAVMHGPLELLFTVQEETGLDGARAVDGSLIGGRLIINLDTEDPRELTIGCAGGAGTILHLATDAHPPAPEAVARELAVSGLKGGHSGIQIHQPLANAIKLLTLVLDRVRDAGVQYQIASIEGGNAHNAIPRDAAAVIVLEPRELPELEAAAQAAASELRLKWLRDEPGLKVTIADAPVPEKCLSRDDRSRLLDLLTELRHGVITMSQDFPGKVETSSNLATIRTGGDEVEVSTSSRSFIDSELEKIQGEIARLGAAAGAGVQVRDGYPGWQPNRGSRLLTLAEEAYRRVYGEEPLVEVVHAGLECGVILDRLPAAEATSFGPRIEGAHTPEERVSIPTVTTSWLLLVELLRALAAQGESS
jgi:dipeptidase D